jgi:hypothetical protein
MNLMTLVRLVVVLVIGWTVVALGAGALGVGERESAGLTFFVPGPSHQDAISEGSLESPADAQYCLLDQTSGQMKPLTLPARQAWSLLSVSPWRDCDGNLEAVGRWVRRSDQDEEFGGIACLTLPDSKIKKCVALDVLPTGKPCWVYGRPGEVLFPAGDGQLYRCNIGGRPDENAANDSRKVPLQNEKQVVKARPVVWETEIPSSGVVFVNDPAGSPDPLVRHLVFASLSRQELRNGRRVNLPPKLWWLVMNDEGDAIVKAGRLTQPGPEESENDSIFERLPSVVIGAGGNLSLAYLTRNSCEMSWQLHLAELEIDAESRLPRMKPRAQPHPLAKGLAPSALVVSANGESVHALDRSGQIVKLSISK